ncbi:hypothetical protein F3Y22_tig00113548pilonHSYRG00073 [Hibiscus syriacus]|uniref:Agglutinin domain-containing protein n=1 Tax=Hibiscus syriacus TaxID=106335 RepID=A0A6A2X1Q3_HIBSY|nr:uncharacterized protein LOC120186474 [Hibiscus syriacus]KAE8662300.1 hypothetical protein F3Y22_tig00113548pilonHSYRG00073 [Hibiscus syriacus]
MASVVPRFIVIESYQDVGYLSYIHEGGDADGFMRFMKLEVTSPYAKFEVESSNTEGLVHIRSCQSNKYWQRTSLPSFPAGAWTATTSKEKEEDESKESCTLLKFISVDPAANKFRIMHVQSGCYVCKWGSEDQKFDQGMLISYKETDWQGADVFTIIDWTSLVILPRHVAFKGCNDKYLCLYKVTSPYFGSDDIGESTVACEIIPVKDGNIRIKSSSTGQFFRCDAKWIWADTYDTATDHVDSLFRPVKIDNDKIALISLCTNKFCRMLSEDGFGDALAAVEPSVIKEAQITVDEPVMTRKIYDVKYDLDNSRIYDNAVIVVAQNSASNLTEEPSTLDVKLTYTDTKSSSWKSAFSLTLGMKTSINLDVPEIFDGNIEFSTQVQSGVEWGKVFESTTDLEVSHSIVVPPMSKVTVNLVATKGMCNVPFSYRQSDTLYDGSTVLTEVQGGTYYGSNYYGMKFEDNQRRYLQGPKSNLIYILQQERWVCLHVLSLLGFGL